MARFSCEGKCNPALTHVPKHLGPRVVVPDFGLAARVSALPYVCLRLPAKLHHKSGCQACTHVIVLYAGPSNCLSCASAVA